MSLVLPLLILLSKSRDIRMEQHTEHHPSSAAHTGISRAKKSDPPSPVAASIDSPTARTNGQKKPIIAHHSTVISSNSVVDNGQRVKNNRTSLARAPTPESSHSSTSSDSEATSSSGTSSETEESHANDHGCCAHIYHRCYCYRQLKSQSDDLVPVNRQILTQLLNNLHQQSKFNRRLLSRHLDIFEEALSGYNELGITSNKE